MGKRVGGYSVQQRAGSEIQFSRGMAGQDSNRHSQNVCEPRKLNESRAFAFQRHDTAQIPRAELSLVWLFGIYSGACDGERGNE